MPRGQVHLDEGFSEDTRSFADSEMTYTNDDGGSMDAIQSMLANLPAEQRSRAWHFPTRSTPHTPSY